MFGALIGMMAMGLNACASPEPGAGGRPDTTLAAALARHEAGSPPGPGAAAERQEAVIPPGAGEARARLAASPRHGEWVMVRTGPTDSVRSWVVYPERADRAPVVLVVHEIFGLTSWVRSVADQLAADGFIALAPDLLTVQDIPADSTGDPVPAAATAAIRTVERAAVHRQLQAVARYGMSLPAARQSYGIVGFCWGGATAFGHAVEAAELKAAVVYYGSSPATSELGAVRAPVLGLYGGDDARVNASIAPADSALEALGRRYEPHIFPGAGHGFLRQQDGRDGANLRASREAWRLTVAWLREHL